MACSASDEALSVKPNIQTTVQNKTRLLMDDWMLVASEEATWGSVMAKQDLIWPCSKGSSQRSCWGLLPYRANTYNPHTTFWVQRVCALACLAGLQSLTRTQDDGGKAGSDLALRQGQQPALLLCLLPHQANTYDHTEDFGIWRVCALACLPGSHSLTRTQDDDGSMYN